VISALQEDVETTANLFGGYFDGRLAPKPVRLFHCRREENTSCVRKPPNLRNEVREDACAGDLGDHAPELSTAPYLGSTKRDGLMLGEIRALNLIDRLRQEERLPLEQRDPGEDEVPIVRVVLVTGFIHVEEVHGRALEGRRACRFRQALRKGNWRAPSRK
jgi:hypothetical protein